MDTVYDTDSRNDRLVELGSGDDLRVVRVETSHLRLQHLRPRQRQRLRQGMSAKLKVVVSDKAETLLVPIAAVRIQRGQMLLRVKDPESGRLRSIKVETGATTLDEVEILSGIEAGDEVVISAA